VAKNSALGISGYYSVNGRFTLGDEPGPRSWSRGGSGIGCGWQNGRNPCAAISPHRDPNVHPIALLTQLTTSKFARQLARVAFRDTYPPVRRARRSSRLENRSHLCHAKGWHSILSNAPPRNNSPGKASATVRRTFWP